MFSRFYFLRFARVDDKVSFLYKGKEREGQVVEVCKTFVRLKTADGFRSFTYVHISMLRNLSVV